MILKKSLVLTVVALSIVAFAAPGFSQGRGKAELKTPGGSITIDYGRPSIKGKFAQGHDPLTLPWPDEFWRMGANEATVFTTPVELTFGAVKVPKGSYSLWLHKKEGDKFDLVFNSQTGQWGTDHDPSKDVYRVPMTKASLGNSVEVFAIDLKPASQGGVFEMSWGTTKLSTNFLAK